MGGKLEGQKLQETALARGQNVRLPVVDESRRPALKRTKPSLVVSIVPERLLLASKKWWEAEVSRRCQRRTVERFKRTA